MGWQSLSAGAGDRAYELLTQLKDAPDYFILRKDWCAAARPVPGQAAAAAPLVCSRVRLLKGTDPRSYE